jgi:hypothetical protein
MSGVKMEDKRSVSSEGDEWMIKYGELVMSI